MHTVDLTRYGFDVDDWETVGFVLNEAATKQGTIEEETGIALESYRETVRKAIGALQEAYGL